MTMTDNERKVWSLGIVVFGGLLVLLGWAVYDYNCRELEAQEKVDLEHPGVWRHK